MEQDSILIIVLGVGVVLGLGGVMYWARGSNADPFIKLLQTDSPTIAEARRALEDEGIDSQVKNDDNGVVRDKESVIFVRASDHGRAVVALQDAKILPR